MNLGEWYIEILLEALGYGVRYWPGQARGDEPCAHMIGSGVMEGYLRHILRRSSRVVLWGAGNGYSAEEAPRVAEYPGRVDVRALRGPLTAGDCGVGEAVPLCDPTFLLPYLYPSWGPRGLEVLYIPHASLRSGAAEEARGLGAEYVDIFSDREGAVRTLGRIARARFVLTSALHVAIACLAYGTGFCVYVPRGRELGMPRKWRDVFYSLGRVAPVPVDSPAAAAGAAPIRAGSPPDVSRLLKAFPREMAS